MNELLERCHKAHLKVLADFKKVCEKHSLKYFAFCGTLLGAVRHKGFIPWDDDLDICMMRSDYNLFLYYAKQEMPGYSFDTFDSYTPEEGRHYDFTGITRINNTYVANFEPEHLEAFSGFPYSAGIDLYPLDYVPCDEEYEVSLAVYRYILMTGYKYKALSWGNYNPPELPEISLGAAYKEIYRSTHVKIDRTKDVLKQLNNLAVKISSYPQKSNRVACMMHTANNERLIFPTSAFRGRQEVPFEDTTIFIPGDADAVLKINYGPGYMTPDNHSPHDFPYYKFQERWVVDFLTLHPEMSIYIPKILVEDVYQERKEKLDWIYGGKE